MILPKTDATVAESKMLVDRMTLTEREVDVCVEGKMGGHPFILSVECRDHERVSDVKWIEEMKAKHERLPANALILASRKGFSAEAHRIAKLCGIELVSLSEVDEIDFPKLLGLNSPLWLKTVTLSTEKVTVTVLPTADLPAETVVAVPDTAVYLPNGSELCPMSVLVQRLVEMRQVGDWLLTDGREDHGWFEIGWPPEADKPVFLKKLEPEILRRVQIVKINGKCKVHVREFGMRGSKLREIEFAWGKTEILGHDALVVATKDAIGSKKVSLNLTPQKNLSLALLDGS